MPKLRVAVDSNLLLLLIVGSTSTSYINTHKRLKAFSVDDFELLNNELKVASEILVTPNTLSETSNLIDHINEPARSAIYKKFRVLIELGSVESYVPSREAAERKELPRIGLTDCALLEVCKQNVVLITVDLDLYHAALAANLQALNFNHLRDNVA